MPDLATSNSGVSNIGFLPNSSGSDVSGGSGFDWGPYAGVIGAGAGVAGSLAFAPKPVNVGGPISTIEGDAAALGAQGKSLTGQGQAALDPVLKYFQALTSGDPSAALAATQPQRGRVIDQYDAARRSASQFTPRGGGQASSEMASRAQEAGQLADTTSAARSEGAKELATLGSDITKTGLSAEEASYQSMASVLGPLLQQQAASGKSAGALWGSIGEIVGSVALDVATGGAAVPFTAGLTAQGAQGAIKNA